jgi:hypothetical protein
MARAIGFFTIAVILLWSLLSLGAWALLSFGGDLIYRQLDWMFGGDPNVVPAAAALFRFFQNLGLGLVLVVWALGTFFVWIVGTIMRRIAQSMTVIRIREAEWADVYEGERPMKDVTPPRPARSLPPS